MKKSFIALFLLLPLLVAAQQKPQTTVPVELMFGIQRTSFQLSLNKWVTGKLYYNNITSVTTNYDIAKERPELTIINSLIYRFHPNFGASGGLQYHFLKGFVPNIAFHASYVDPTWMLMFAPYLNFLPDRNSETLVQVEFKPELSRNVRLYSRATVLYSHNLTDNHHDRSFYYFRLGLTVRRVTFGAGANFDYYGPGRHYKENFGGFLRVAI